VMRAVVTVVGLAHMGVWDLVRREFDARPVAVLWAITSPLVVAEYYTAWVKGIGPLLEAWGAAYAAIVAALWIARRLGYTEDGDVFGVAFTLFNNVLSPLDPVGDWWFQSVLMLSIAGVLSVAVVASWRRREVTVAEFLEKPHRYVYRGGLGLGDPPPGVPAGSYTLDVVVPKLREMVESGKVKPGERIRVEPGLPLLFLLLVSYALCVSARWVAWTAGWF